MDDGAFWSEETREVAGMERNTNDIAGVGGERPGLDGRAVADDEAKCGGVADALYRGGRSGGVVRERRSTPQTWTSAPAGRATSRTSKSRVVRRRCEERCSVRLTQGLAAQRQAIGWATSLSTEDDGEGRAGRGDAFFARACQSR